MHAQLQLGPDDARTIAAHVAELLEDAARQVARDPDATRTRIAEAAMLLGPLQPPSGGETVRMLAPWQERSVRAYVEAHLDAPIRIETLAETARLSTRYFFRAFRGSFGMAPHAYVMRRRIDRAKQLLIAGDEALAGIAAACGFADQAHFSRVFARCAGVPPGTWRRLRRSAMA